MKNTDAFFESIQKQIDEFMGDQNHSYIMVVHQCGENDCQMNLTTNLAEEGIVTMAIEVLEQYAPRVDGLEIEAVPIKGGEDGGNGRLH